MALFPMKRAGSSGGSAQLSVLATASDTTIWTADKDYSSIAAFGVRGSTPVVSYTGSGTFTEVFSYDAGSYKTRAYIISNVKSGDKVTLHYKGVIVG